MEPYSSQWSAATRALLMGVLITAIFFWWAPPGERGVLTTVQVLVALIGVVTGVKLGFFLATNSGLLARLSRIGAYHYTAVTALGFFFGALWATGGGSAWPLVTWFLLAGILEAIASCIGRSRAQNAS